MCVAHEHGGDKSGIRKTRKLADASYVIQLTALKKCCNITKVVVGKVHFTHVYTCIQMRKMHFISVRRQKKSKELKRCLNILQNVSAWR